MLLASCRYLDLSACAHRHTHLYYGFFLTTIRYGKALRHFSSEVTGAVLVLLLVALFWSAVHQSNSSPG